MLVPEGMFCGDRAAVHGDVPGVDASCIGMVTGPTMSEIFPPHVRGIGMGIGVFAVDDHLPDRLLLPADGRLDRRLRDVLHFVRLELAAIVWVKRWCRRPRARASRTWSTSSRHLAAKYLRPQQSPPRNPLLD